MRDPLPGLLAAIRDAAVPLLRPHGAVRLSVVGVTGDAMAPGEDIHLLVEFAEGAAALDLATWLRVQREITRASGLRVELITVDGLLARVAEDNVALTVLYDATGPGGSADGG